MLRLQVSDSIGYALLIQPCTALSCYQAAPGMQLLKANTIDVANIGAWRFFLPFWKPFNSKPHPPICYELIWKPQSHFSLAASTAFAALSLLIIIAAILLQIHSSQRSKGSSFSSHLQSATVKMFSSFILKTNKQTPKQNPHKSWGDKIEAIWFMFLSKTYTALTTSKTTSLQSAEKYGKRLWQKCGTSFQTLVNWGKTGSQASEITDTAFLLTHLASMHTYFPYWKLKSQIFKKKSPTNSSLAVVKAKLQTCQLAPQQYEAWLEERKQILETA